MSISDAAKTSKQKKTVGIIMAAGKGTRMKPLTETTPKPLAQIKSGQTLLEINLDKLLDIVDEFVIVVNYLGQQIVDKIGSSYKSKPVIYAWTQTPTTGTFDAFRQGIYADSSFKTNLASFVVTNSDNVLDTEYYQILDNHITQKPEQPALIATETEDNEVLSASGVFVVDENSELVSVVEKPQQYVSNLVNLGLYYFPNFVFDFVNSVRPETNQEEFITDLFEACNAHSRVKILSANADYSLISTVKDLDKVSLF
jgi:UDP-N-acetylglucosamine diphosphorylase / glucose-1-phosphate thymidylyltransferase / UDP-N-acetylgalactosamine diphosphorylase / glucosamine-1-phosphate N-acetyltransferase / galactosamine-1-phosphate N-acetyltransferase